MPWTAAVSAPQYLGARENFTEITTCLFITDLLHLAHRQAVRGALMVGWSSSLDPQSSYITIHSGSWYLEPTKMFTPGPCAVYNVQCSMDVSAKNLLSAESQTAICYLLAALLSFGGLSPKLGIYPQFRDTISSSGIYQFPSQSIPMVSLYRG